MRNRLALSTLATCLGSGLADDAGAEIKLSIVSTAPARPHFVAAGASTTFVIEVKNTGALPVPVAIQINPVSAAPGDWEPALAAADRLFRPIGVPRPQATIVVPANDSVPILAQLLAAHALPDGSEGNAVITASGAGMVPASVGVKARVRNRPKVYYVAIDGCGRGYLTLNRKGRLFLGVGERLMPRAWEFASRSAQMTRAASVLPAVTDPNHSAALTGSWAGTLGVYQVKGQYMGQGPSGRDVIGDVGRDSLRWGAEGHRVTSVFDAAKDPSLDGSASTFNAMVTGKSWLADLFSDHHLDLAVHGSSYPEYVPAPASYRVGDPLSDDDPERDQEGTNVGPWLTRHRYDTEALLMGVQPSVFPADRWLGEAAVRVIQAEDPDVLYVDLAASDPVQHVFGAADRPQEWEDPGTPDALWDDENVYNRGANRDPVLDVVHEADWNFGMISDALAARQALDRSLLVLMSDHGHITAMNTLDTLVDPGRILLDGGITEADVERIANRGQLGHIALTDATKAGRVERLLEAYEMLDPVSGRMAKPLLVINREEMDSGRDGATGVFGANDLVGDRRGELYSEWSIDAPVTDNSKVRWPDLFVFTRDHFRTKISTNLASIPGAGPPLNGVHGGPSSGDILLMIGGPGVRPGTYGAAVSTADLGATVFELLRVPPPANVDGRVLHEILQ